MRIELLLCLAGCGAPLVDDSYRGEPLFSVEGQIETFVAPDPDIKDQNIRASIFWVRGDFAELDPRLLLEQPSVSTEIRFPSTFEMRIFEPPTERHFIQTSPPIAAGVVLIYADRDGNGRFSIADVDAIVGGTVEKGIVYAPQGAQVMEGERMVDLPLGFSLLSFSTVCSVVLDVPDPDLCDQPEPCPEGFVCDATAQTCIPPMGMRFCDIPDVCPPGLICNDVLQDCLPPQGDFCDEPGVCPPELFCDPIAELCLPPDVEFCASPVPCPEGFYCEPEIQDCVPDEISQAFCEENEDCPEGHRCEGPLGCLPDGQEGPLKMRIGPDFSLGEVLCGPGF